MFFIHNNSFISLKCLLKNVFYTHEMINAKNLNSTLVVSFVENAIAIDCATDEDFFDSVAETFCVEEIDEPNLVDHLCALPAVHRTAAVLVSELAKRLFPDHRSVLHPYT